MIAGFVGSKRKKKTEGGVRLKLKTWSMSEQAKNNYRFNSRIEESKSIKNDWIGILETLEIPKTG